MSRSIASRRARPPLAARLVRSRLGLLGAAGIAILLAGCGGATGQPSASVLPSASATADAAVRATQVRLEDSLRSAGFGLIGHAQPYRPPETQALAGAPRSVFQVVLPQDPSHGLVVVYDLGDPGAATEAATGYAAYLESGPIRVEFPPDTRFVLRQLGGTLIFSSWSAASSPDPSGARALDALETIGQGFPIR